MKSQRTGISAVGAVSFLKAVMREAIIESTCATEMALSFRHWIKNDMFILKVGTRRSVCSAVLSMVTQLTPTCCSTYFITVTVTCGSSALRFFSNSPSAARTKSIAATYRTSFVPSLAMVPHASDSCFNSSPLT